MTATLYHEHEHSHLYVERFYLDTHGSSSERYRIVVEAIPATLNKYRASFYVWSFNTGWVFLIDEDIAVSNIRETFSHTLEHGLGFLE